VKQNMSGWDEAFFFAQAVNYGRAKKQEWLKIVGGLPLKGCVLGGSSHLVSGL